MSEKLRISPAILGLFVLIVSADAALQPPKQWTVASPADNISISIVQKVLGEPFPLQNNLYYCVELNGKRILPYTPLGVTMSGADGNFVSDLIFIRQSEKVIDETYPMISGKKSRHHNLANEKTLVFKNAESNIVHVIFRAYNDGIAYRYHFQGTGSREITAESSGFRLPPESVGWLQRYVSHYEDYYLKNNGSNDTKHEVGFPALFHTSTGAWVLVTEAAVYGNYGGSRLSRSVGTPNIFQVKIPHKLSGNLPWTTPWRVAIIGKNLGIIVESVLVDNLNPPCEVNDLSWIKPGRVTFPWWSDHAVSGKFEELKTFVDFAYEMGWEWIEFDTGLVGGHITDTWMNTPWVSELVDYARSKGVNVYGWDSWRKLDTPEKRNKILGLFKKLGIKGIKIDYLESDSQKMFQFRDEVVEACMKQQLMVSFHGSTLSRGQQRRWPHIMTWEAVLGGEYYTFGNKLPTPSHNCTLPFTRNVVGPMDYTPVTFSAKGKTTTNAHELALSVIFESGWQNISDTPQAYAASLGKSFLKQVPATWDDIHFIDGYPGEFVCLARRKGNDWFIAAINAKTARTITVPLNFLKQGTYSIKLYRDGRAGEGIIVENLTLESSKPFGVSLPTNGGFCMRIANSYDSQIELGRFE